ncbi:hypothetical protein G6F56_003512 [Rhizopus delemar]|nr:hypothetical protein G6F56_003512 [Rhizopus delemar]
MKLLTIFYFLAILKLAVAVKVCSLSVEIDDNQYLNAVGRGMSASQCKSKLKTVAHALDNLKTNKTFDDSTYKCKGTSCVVSTYSNYKCGIVKAVRKSGFEVPSTFKLCD